MFSISIFGSISSAYDSPTSVTNVICILHSQGAEVKVRVANRLLAVASKAGSISTGLAYQAHYMEFYERRVIVTNIPEQEYKPADQYII